MSELINTKILLRFSILLLIIPQLHQSCAGTAILSSGAITGESIFASEISEVLTVSEDHKSSVRLSNYNDLELQGTDVLDAAPGTKSVLFNNDGTRLYAMNLEGMSVYEFDQATRRLVREFKFKPTKGVGWDYETDKPIPSFEEKPVEACLSHDDRILWVSLHNAAGIVPIHVGTFASPAVVDSGITTKTIYLRNENETTSDSMLVPLVRTGKTPKIISRTADSRYLLVSNWHSNTISVLETDTSTYPYAKVIRTIPVGAIPRGVVVDDKSRRSYVAIMGGASISVLDNDNWARKPSIPVAANPRHMVLDSAGRILVSYNRLGKIACIDPVSGKTMFSAKTAAQPRTIMLSKNKRFLFVTCYSSDTVQVYKVNRKGFSRLLSLPCKGHPVGVDIVEDDDKLEAWVCSYTNGSINVYTFRKKYQPDETQ